ncbi:hypothetical protein PMIN01_00386 [Paraphaeosphaeria minitans]|uniref:Uncharacterized protein n=1 Tax=Paraphaeosphaeria minitans TaxID=565426 RepID=A0A9P6GS53_9PLEO|nr:hypothetical protein PMIN01_00386 [Paraphaeosphaeria minitans]
MTPEERETYTDHYFENGTCFPREEPLHPLGQVDELVIKLAALETCQKIHRDSPVGATNISIPRIQNVTDRLFYNKDWMTTIYWNITDNKQYAVGIRFAVDWQNAMYPHESLNMDFYRCKELIYSTAGCGFAGDRAGPVGSGVGLYRHQNHILLVEVESRELFENERVANPRRILPLKPQEGMVTYVHSPLPTPGVTTVYVYVTTSGVAEASPTPVGSTNAGLLDY